MGNIKLREADLIIQYILTDIYHGIDGEIYYEHRDGQDLYTVSLEGDQRNREDGKQTLTVSKITMGSRKSVKELGSTPWIGTRDDHTQAARQWVYDTIQAA